MGKYWYEFRLRGSGDSDCVGTWSRTDAIKWLDNHPAAWVNVYDGEYSIYTVMLGKLLKGGD